MAGRPASSAYAIPWGTRSVVRTRPATRSLPSRAGRYDRSIASPGIVWERASRRDVPSAAIAVLLLAGHLAGDRGGFIRKAPATPPTVAGPASHVHRSLSAILRGGRPFGPRTPGGCLGSHTQ